ncbi:uncharacterized protein B0P05DRAFT_462612, partial [Gilbertella persicaria]|uniref:uncharacterized protein n=1 Tax=Gilbertella persicaria TaxID=101096 RepID=UPI00221F1AF0
MDDNSSSDEEGGRIRFDITQDDLDAEVSGFSGFQRQRFRNSHDSSSEEEDRQEGLSGLGLAPSFQTAKQTPVKDPVKEKVRARQTGSPSPGPGFAEFNKHSKGFGQKMLEKMGWNRGQGLGADGSGIVNPVDIKQRPARMGLSFKGFDERTDQAKQEAKLRRGEEPGEDEKPKPSKRDAWKSTAPSEKKTRKPKTIYKTAADILAEAEESIALPQRVIDMTGPGIREINLADIKRTDSPTLMEVTTRLPELRHNLSLIVDLARMDLENLSREKQTTAFRMKSLQTELDTIQHNLEKEQQQLAKIEQLKTIAQRLEQISKDGLATGAFKKGNMTSLFGEQFDILSRD